MYIFIMAIIYFFAFYKTSEIKNNSLYKVFFIFFIPNKYGHSGDGINGRLNNYFIEGVQVCRRFWNRMNIII